MSVDAQGPCSLLVGDCKIPLVGENQALGVAWVGGSAEQWQEKGCEDGMC